MAIAKQERQQLEHDIHQRANEGGLVKMRELLCETRDELNRKWPRATGEDAFRVQGCALMVDTLLRVIENGPRIPVPVDRPDRGDQT